MRQILSCAPVLKVLVIGEDFKGLREAFEVVSPGFKGTDDGEEFLVIDLVILFGWGQGVGEIGDR